MNTQVILPKIVGGLGTWGLLQSTLPLSVADNPWLGLVYIFVGGVGIEIIRQIATYKTQKLKNNQEQSKEMHTVIREDLKDIAGMNKELREDLEEATQRNLSAQKELMGAMRDSHEKEMRIRELEHRLQMLESQRRSDRLEIGQALQTLGEELSDANSTNSTSEKGRAKKR